MRFRIEWTQEDLENLLTETLRTNGFVVDKEFKWKYRPKLRVSVEIEQPTEMAKKTIEELPTEASKKTVEEILQDSSSDSFAEKVRKASIDDFDPSLFPPGANIEALRAIEHAIRKEKK